MSAKKAKRHASKAAPEPTPDFDAALGAMSDAIAIVATAAAALETLIRLGGYPEGLDDYTHTLQHGLLAIRAAYDRLDRLDVAIPAVRS